MFKKIFIENNLLNNERTLKILNMFKNSEIVEVDKVENYWGRKKKPYLQKNGNLNLFIGQKQGLLVKEAPDAYGLKGQQHYYYVHNYNCIYECQYCYLQGYFNTPDIVLYINHEEIISQMKSKLLDDKKVWFHAGEFSDSLALSHITGEIESYYNFFKDNSNALWELRTKSVNIKVFDNIDPIDNLYISFSISDHHHSKEIDLKTPSVSNRIKAAKKLVEKGFKVAFHIDPLIYSPDFEEKHLILVKELLETIPHKYIEYISIGVVRFTKDVFKEVQQNYPKSKLLAQDFIKSFDNKYRYSRPMRNWMLNKVYEQLTSEGIDSDKIYRCMED